MSVRNKQMATWLYKEDIEYLRQFKQVKNGKIESDAEAFKKIIRQSEKDDERAMVQMDKRRRMFI